MCEIKDQVNKFVNDHIAFSAYDITISLRNDGNRINHDRAKNVVHNMFLNDELDPGYERTLLLIPNINKKAFVYHHITFDVNDYEPIKATYQCTIVNRIGDRNKQPIGDVLNIAYAKQDGRLTIPRVLIKKAGIVNSNYSIETNQNNIIISASTVKDKMPQKSGTIEIPRKFIKHLSKNAYKISLQGNSIYVE